MIRTILLAAALAAIIAAVQTLRVSRLTARAEAAEAQVAGYAEAVRIRREADRRQAELRAAAEALDHDLQAMEGGDALLSDYLGRAAGRLWP